MKNRNRIFMIVVLVLALLLVTGLALADDGQMFRRNISKTPDGETEEAAIAMMPFYVPAQSSSGELVELDYFDAAGVFVETRSEAKPLVSIYVDGIEVEDEEFARVTGIEFDGRLAVSRKRGWCWSARCLCCLITR